MILVCLGDSITQSGKDGGWTDEMQAQLGSRHVVINAGVGGDTTAMALDRYARDVIPHQPQIVIVEFGLNDCYVPLERQIARVSLQEYARNLREIVRLAQSQKAVPVIIVNHDVQTGAQHHLQGNERSLEENVAPYNAMSRLIAQENNLQTIDFPALLSPEEARILLSDDKVHLSEAGQAIYASRVLDGVRPLLG